MVEAGRWGAIETGSFDDRGAGRGNGGGDAGVRGAGLSAACLSPPEGAGSGGRGGSGVMMLTGGIEAAEGKSWPGESGLATSGGLAPGTPFGSVASAVAGFSSPDGHRSAWRATRRSKAPSRKFDLMRSAFVTLAGATGIRGKDLGDDTEPIGFDPSP